jgi:hypothetical protein
MPRFADDGQRVSLRAGLRSSTVLTLALMLGAGTVAGAAVVWTVTPSPAQANTRAANPCAANPCAANACAANPCAANPCAANPCAANPCIANPCAANPCAAAEAATGCFVPRLQQAAANPCAACAPASCSACAANPCAANPCAAHSANTCAPANPCAADPCMAANPCAANPCAANPCAANPCAANPCAATAAPPEVSDEELQALYACLIDHMEQQDATLDSGTAVHAASWSLSDRPEGRDFAGWTNFALTPYISFTHGERFATNHANAIAAPHYGRFEEIEDMPAGGIIAKPTFGIGSDGQAFWDTLFLMERAAPGTSPDTNDWIYTAVLADGSLMGRTLGQNSDRMYFCAACHMGGGADTLDLLFLDPEYRVQN